MNNGYLYQYIYISTSIELIIYFFKLHEIINKHVLAYACYYSFCNESLMIHVFFQRYKYFTPYEKNVSFQFLIFLLITRISQVIIN